MKLSLLKNLFFNSSPQEKPEILVDDRHILKREPLISYDAYLAQATSDEEKAALADNIAYMLEYNEETKYTDEWNSAADVKINEKEFSKITVK